LAFLSFAVCIGKQNCANCRFWYTDGIIIHFDVSGTPFFIYGAFFLNFKGEFLFTFFKKAL